MLRAVSSAVGLALTISAAAQAAPGDLDTTFSGDGLAFTDAGLGDERANALLREADGSLIVAGVDATEEMFVARYTPAGALDLSFGDGDGIARITFPDHGRGSRADALAFGPGGTIVVAGGATTSGGNAVFASDDVAVARLTSSGALDESFSDDGRVTFGFPGQSFAGSQVGAVAVQSGGAIAVAATVDDGDRDRMGAARLTAAGAPDPTFSGDGRVLLDFGPDSYDEARGIAIQSDGKLVVAGGSDGQLAMARLTTAGVPDATYAGDGTSTIADDNAFGLVLQPDDKAVVVAYQSIARVGTTGTLDSSFAGDGTATVTAGGDDELRALALGPNGTVVAVGHEYETPGKATVARLTTAGSPDTTFSGDGRLSAAIGTDPRAAAVVVDSAGAVTVAGSTHMGATGIDVALGRFTSDGVSDTSFGNGGARTTNFGYGGADSATSVRALPGGKLLVTLHSGAARYLADGTLDPSYGTGGVVATPLSGVAETTPDGGLVVAGRAADGAMALRRYTASGSPDGSFGTGGSAPLDLPDEADGWRNLDSVLVGADGKIVVAGSIDERAFVARFLSTGVKDSSFSGDGYAEATLVTGSSYVSVAGAVLQDGRPLLVGYEGDSGARVARFTRSGQLDTAFGTAGIADAGGAVPGALAVDHAGRIIVAGSAKAPDHLDSAVSRLTPTGARDSTFSGDGIASVNLGANDYLRGVTVDGDDRILVAGTRGGELDGEETLPGGPRPTLARFRVDGAVDDSFAGTGSTVLATGRRAESNGVGLDAAGNVLSVGISTPSDRFGAAADAFIARVIGGGSPAGDANAPDTSITDAPPAEDEDTTPTFTFSATGGPVTFECRVDDADFSPCTSPHTTSVLAAGSHAFAVRAIDGSGNVDRTPALATFLVEAAGPPPDIAAPAISIATPAQGQHFALGADVASSYACTDTGGSGVASCAGPAKVDTAAAGTKTFTVQAADAAGNTSSKTVTYLVDAPITPPGDGAGSGGDGGAGAGGTSPPPPTDTTPPAIVASGGSITPATNGKLAFGLGPFGEHTTGTVAIRSAPVSASGARAAAKKVVLDLGRKPFTAAAGKKLRVGFKLSAKQRKILAKRRKIRMTATIVARDNTGNSTTKKVPFTLKAPKRKG